MFKNILRPFENAELGWLGREQRIFTLTLLGIEDCFDAHSLWEAKFGGNPKINEQKTGRADLRLKEALDAHRYVAYEMNKQSLFEGIDRVFTDVVVWIPANDWRRDRVERKSQSLIALAHNLTEFHREDFGDTLLYDRHPSYVVMEGSDLAEGCVVFQFGPGVFVPGSADQQVARFEVKTSNDTDWVSVPDYIFFEAGKEIRRPPGIYAGQDGLSLGAELDSAVVHPQKEAGKSEQGDPITVPYWFSHSKGSIFINYSLGGGQFAFGDREFVSWGEIHSQDEKTGETVFVFHDVLHGSDAPDGEPEAYYLKVTPVATPPRPKQPAPTPGRQPRTGRRIGTIYVGTSERAKNAGLAPMRSPHLLLEGYALPRIDTNRIADLEKWALLLDEKGNLVEDPVSDAKTESKYLTLCARADKNVLLIRQPGKKKFKEVRRYPWQFTNKMGVQFEIAPTPADQNYFGILQIPDPAFFFPLQSNKSLKLGRSDPNSESMPDLCLDILKNPDSLLWAEGRGQPGAFLGAVGLSRTHAVIQLVENGLEVIQQSQSVPIWCISDEGRIKARLEPKGPKQDSESIVLEPGERLLLGCCLLRFELGRESRDVKDWAGGTIEYEL